MNTYTFNSITFATDLDFSTSIQVEDITDRVDELRDELESAHDEKETTLSFEYALQDAANFADNAADYAEFVGLTKILSEIEGNGGDHQWNGNWYPQELLHDDDFERRMDELVRDCYSLPELPSFCRITLDYVALRQDYTEIEIDGNTLLMR